MASTTSQPKTSSKPICGAGTAKGGICQSTVLMENGRCRVHGGATPRGLASPHFKHGRYSKVLNGVLAQHYETALDNINLLSLMDEIALVDAQIQALVDGKAPEDIPFQKVSRLIEQRRRLAETERRRITEAEQTMNMDQLRATIAFIMNVLQERVNDRAIIAAIQRDFRTLVAERTRGRTG